jgi:hypothetical protein
MSLYDELGKKLTEKSRKRSLYEELGERMTYKSIDTSGVDKSYIDSLINDATDYISTAEKDYGGVGYGNASSTYDNKYSTWKDLSTRSRTIRAWLFNNRNSLDTETYNGLMSDLYNIEDSIKSVRDGFKSASDYYAQWDTEDAYNTWYEGYKAQQELLNSEDFEHYSQIGANIENPTYSEAQGWIQIGAWRPFGEDIGNIVTFSRDNIDSITKEIGLSNSNADISNVLGDYRYQFMTDDEVAIYNYYLGKGDTEKAAEYLKSLDDTLNQRHAGDIVERVDGNPFLEIVFSAGAGLDQFASGIGNIDNLIKGTESDPTTVTQYAQSQMQANNEGLFKVANDLVYTTGNMLPSILVGSLTGGLGGTITLGTSAVGNGYAEMRNLGYDEWQSRGYGLLVGASEATLQYFLGGISKLGGKVSGNAVGKLVSKIDNAFARTAIKLGGNMASEGLEEAIQTVLEPMFMALMTGEDFESPEWDEILYSALLGALSAGMLEGVPTIADTVFNNHQAKKVYGSESQALVAESLDIDPDNAYAQKMQAKLDKGKNLSGGQINRLVESNEQTLNTQDTAKMKSAVEARLTELGEKGDISKLADVIVKAQSGGTLTKAERSLLVNSKYGRRVSTELNPKSIESGQYASKWAEGIGTERINTEAYNKGLYDLASEKAGIAVGEEKPSVTENTTAKEIVSEGKFKASEDGKAKVGDTEVSIKEIASVKDGEVMLRLEDGSTVNASDVELASADEGLLYENVVHMGLNAATANSFVNGYQAGTDVEDYIKGFKEAYTYGENGFALKDMSEEGFVSTLTDEQKNMAYNLGKIDAKYKKKESESAEEKTAETKEPTAQKNQKKGKLYNKLTPRNETQRASLKALSVLADALGIDIYTFESPTDAKGRRLGENGSYDPRTKTLRIDLYAGNDGKGTMLFTAAHELTHYIRDKHPTKFDEFAGFLFEKYEENGVSVQALVEAKRKFLKEKGRITQNMTLQQAYDLAYEEVVADACESFLADGEAVAKIAELKAKDKTLWETIKDFLTKLVARIKAAYEGLSPDSEAGSRVADMLEAAEELKAMWTEALVEASEVENTPEIVEKDLANKDLLYNLRATESHKQKLPDQYSKDASVSLDSLMQRYNKIISIWERLGGELNSKFLNEWNEKVGKDRAFTVFKAQAGYKYNVELSSMCKKGVPLFEAIDTIVKNEVMKELNTDVIGKAEKEILYDILKDHHFEIPCAICYVEQARQREGVIIDAFLNGKIEKDRNGKTTTFKLGWNEVLNAIEKEMKANGVDYTFKSVDRNIATDKYTPADTSMDETTQEAFYNALKKIANKEISRYNEAEGKSRKLVTSVTPSAIKEVFKGTLPSNLKIFKVLFTEPSSRFTLESDLLYSSMTTHNLAMSHNALYSLFNSQGGVSGYKTKQGTVVYWGDILGKTWQPSKVRDEGGIRNQSNSDFQMYTLLDQAQMYIDFTAKGYYLQAYTKVLSELKLFGLSRGKINASLIPAVYEYHNSDGSVDIETTREYAGLDKNGNLLFDDIEGINHSEAFMLLEDAEYSKNIGGICIGYSDNHILKLLDDNRVQQIIGFHDKTDDPDKRYRGARYAKNYNGLNEAINKDGKTVHIGFNPYVRKAEKMFEYNAKTETYEGEIEYNGKTYVADDIPKLAADLYLEMCEKKGYTPAYTDFDFHENYYKLLADFSLYDSQGHYAPHRKVAYNMPDKVPYLDINGNKKYMATKDYIKSELEKELKVRDAISDALTDTSESGIIPQFKKRVNELHKDKVKYSDRKKKVDETVDKAIKQKGNLGVKYNQEQISEFPADITAFVSAASEGRIDLSEKYIAISGDDIWHEYQRHNDVAIEDGRRQLPLTNETIKEAVMAIYSPDIVESLFSTIQNPTQRQSFAYAKKSPNGYYIVVEAVGGRRNPNVVPVMIVQFSERKWNDMIASGKTLGELIHKNDARLMDSLDVEFNKKNRVTVAQFASKEAIANTPRSPRFEYIIPQDSELVKSKFSDRNPDSFSNRSLLANALESVVQNDIERNKLNEYKNKITIIESEQERLAELNAKLHDLRFRKGKRSLEDNEQIKELQAEATILANRINTYDRQLLNLESTKALKGVLEREKKKAYEKAKQKGQEALKAQKEKSLETLNAQRDYYQEARKRGIESRHKTEMRQKVKKTVNELYQMLLHGTKERNVKVGLQDAVASALQAVNMDTVAADERIAKLEQELVKAKTPEKIQEISRKIDYIRDQGDRMEAKLQKLRKAYEEISTSSNEYYKNEAERIKEKIDDVVEKVGETPLRNMSLSQLQSVYELYKIVLTTVRDANQLFKNGKVEDLRRNVLEMEKELSSIPLLKEERMDIGAGVRKFAWNEMTPVYAFQRIGSPTFTSLYWELIRGQNTYARDYDEADTFATDTRETYHYKKWDLDKIHTFKLSDGREFRVTLRHMMSIYAYSKRDQALDHMSIGGFFFNDKETFTNKGGMFKMIKSNEEGYKVDKKVLSEIINELTDEQIAYVDEMQDYLTKMGEKGNEVSRTVWGIDLFKEKYYFPLKSSQDFIAQSNQPSQATSLKNDGMTKEIKPGASNPIVLEAFDDVWAKHVNRMSQYHAFVIPIENINKVLNYGTWTGDTSKSVTTMIRARYSSAAVDYLNNFVKDCNGSITAQGATSPTIGLIGKFKKTAVAASTSVTLQQPTAVIRATAEIDAKYFIGLDPKRLSTKWEEVRKYAPIAIIKEIGGFDMGGTRASIGLNDDTLTGKDKVMSKIDEYTMKGAEVGDKIGWCIIFDAVKREIKATTNLQEGSEAFLKRVGERFTEVVVLTQVYDSTLSRSGFMRSQSEIAKMATSFMGEPTVSINMMYNAMLQAKRHKITKRKATRIISAVYVSVIMASVASSLIYALRDDDDDESYLEKFGESFVVKALGDLNPVAMLPYARDVVSILQGWDVERTDMSVITDIYNGFTALDSKNKSVWRKIEDFAGSIAAALGIPLKNVLRTAREIYNAIRFTIE